MTENKALSSLNPNTTGEYRINIFKVPIPDSLLLSYFRYIEDNHNFYIPISHSKGKTPKLYFSTNPKYRFGECRVFLLRADCEDWCHELIKNGAKESVVCLPMPSKSLFAMLPNIAQERRKLCLPCVVDCYANVAGVGVKIDRIYDNINQLN